MSLFNFGKKKEETKVCSCSCNCSSFGENEEVKSSCCSQTGTKNIKVLGAGCKSCHELYENTQKAVKNMGLDTGVEYITDMQKVMSYGAMSMPVLVVNEKVVSMGKVLKPKDIEKLLNSVED